MNKQFRKGFQDGVPIGLGYLSVSFAFGIQAVSLGLTPVQALLISLTNLTSAGQLAGIELIAQMAPLVEMALTQLTINLRYALMSLALTQKLDSDMHVGRRAVFAFGNTDEIFAVASSREGKLEHRYLYGLMIAPIIGWSTGTYLGSVAGTLLPEFVRTALGIAIYGMFLAVILPAVRREKAVAVVSALARVLSVLFHYAPGLNRISSGYAMIICALAAAGIGAVLFPQEEDVS